MSHILRAWTFWIHARIQDECHSDMERMVFGRMRQAPGNLRVKALFTDAGDGTVEVAVLSMWESMDHIRAFVGPLYLQPAIPPAYLGKVFDREPQVHHYAVTEVPASYSQVIQDDSN